MSLKKKILKQTKIKESKKTKVERQGRLFDIGSDNTTEAIIQINLAHPKSHLNEMRRAFNVPEKYTDERLLEVLVGYVIDQYMSVEYIDAGVLQDYITDGKITERWL